MKNKKFAVLFIILFVLVSAGLYIILEVFDLSTIRGSDTGNGTSQGQDKTTETTEALTTVTPITEVQTTEAPTTEESIEGPVNLFNCYTTFNDWDNYVELEYNTIDNMGDPHSKSYTIDDYALNDSQDLIIVKLDKKYTRLVIPQMYLMEKSKNCETEYILVFKDYDTGNELGASPMFTRNSKAQSFEIDVTGVEFLEISKRIHSYGPWHNCVVGLDGAYLYTD